MKDNTNPRFTETGAKDHNPQQQAELHKSNDNVGTAEQAQDTPNHPHPGNDGRQGKHSGGSDD